MELESNSLRGRHFSQQPVSDHSFSFFAPLSILHYRKASFIGNESNWEAKCQKRNIDESTGSSELHMSSIVVFMRHLASRNKNLWLEIDRNDVIEKNREAEKERKASGNCSTISPPVRISLIIKNYFSGIYLRWNIRKERISSMSKDLLSVARYPRYTFSQAGQSVLFSNF